MSPLFELVVAELWHVGMPGYTHPAAGSVDDSAYRSEAAVWIAYGGEPFKIAGYGYALALHLLGGDVVRCGEHDRGVIPGMEPF